MSFIFSKLNARERPVDGLTRLRFALETMPSSRKSQFSPSTRNTIIAELYDAFWGSYSHFFLPDSGVAAPTPMQSMLSELQKKTGFGGSGRDIDPVVPGRICGRVFQKGESCYRCKDCALDESCVMCSRCFNATDHTGHNISLYLSQQPGGCCDCGDAEAWRYPIGCPHHPLADSKHLPTKATARTLENWTAKVHNPHRMNIPQDLRDSMSRTIAYALDFILDTLDYAPDEALTPRTEEELRMQPTADPAHMDVFAVTVWNDEKHSFEDIAHIIAGTIGISEDQAMEIAEAVDDQGREVVQIGTNIPKLLEVAHHISQIDLGVTVRRVHDHFREQITAIVIEWLLDLTQSRLMTDNIIIREVIGAELLAPRKKDSSSLTTNLEASKVYAEISDAARLDWLFLYHTRLWKKPRLNLKQVYLSILTLSHEHKLAVAIHFANVYHRIIDSYLLVDREPENSIKYFALRLFTVPSIAQHIVRNHNVVSRLLAIITAFFTNQISNKRITYPPAEPGGIDVETYPFKSKRFMPVFSDLRFICSNESVQTLIAKNPDFLQAFTKVCELFVGVNPNKRAANAHVEYEAEAWISVFNVTVSLSRVIKVYGEAFAKGSESDLLSAMGIVIRSIVSICTLQNNRLDRTKYSKFTFHDVTFGGSTYSVVDFNVLEGWISFHHSLHWLLAELLKHVDLLNPTKLRVTLREMMPASKEDEILLTVIDFPLRVLVMIAQIRSGLWVRNGFAIRGQLLHYRDFMLRELCFDQDIYILQSAFAMLNIDLVLVTMLDRFQLLSWFSGVTGHDAYDHIQLYTMIEEFLFLLITCVNETGNALHLSLDQTIRRELIHALATGPTVFTEFLKRVPERLVEDVSFERVLNQVANYKMPEATADTGVYELKEEFYDEVDPFFHHYSRNKREEVVAILRNRLSKQTGSKDPVLVPKRLGLTSGPFAVLSSILISDSLLTILYHTIANIIHETDSSGAIPASADAILDQILFLVMLGLIEHPRAFAKKACQQVFHDQLTLLDALHSFEQHDKFKSFKARVSWVLDGISKEEPTTVTALRRRAEQMHRRPTVSEEDKKKAAKLRRAALLKNFATAQKKFLNTLEGSEDDEDSAMLDTSNVSSYGVCIVCQEDLDESKSFGALGFVQPSRILRNTPEGCNDALHHILLSPDSLDRKADIQDISGTHNQPVFPVAALAERAVFGMQASVCGHLMHLDCFSVYGSSIRQRHRTQAQRNHPECIARKEFICPLCKSLGNVLLPAPSLQSSFIPNTQTFVDWVRSSGIELLRSPPDVAFEELQTKIYGNFTFWGAQDGEYQSRSRTADDLDDLHKMVETLLTVSKNISIQSRHLRVRLEPEPGERGAGAYLPEDLIAYTISALEVAQRGANALNASIIDAISEHTNQMIRGLLSSLFKLLCLQFRDRETLGSDSIRLSVIKRLLPEWKRESPYRQPLILRDHLAVLVEVATVAPESLNHATVLLYYAHLARVVIGILSLFSRGQMSGSFGLPSLPSVRAGSKNLLDDISTFILSITRHSPSLERTAQVLLTALGTERLGSLLYTFTLPFLRRAALLCNAVNPALVGEPDGLESNEYSRLLQMLHIPSPNKVSKMETIQNLLSGWCNHFGQIYNIMPQDITVSLEYPSFYCMAQLPHILDTLFTPENNAPVCTRCKSSPTDAGICLICGTIVCIQSHCCRENDYKEMGECNMHTRECGGVIGLYFSIKRCAIIYLYANNGIFQQAPYLDNHGEADLCMRRGRRQFLHPPRMEEIRRVWLNHGIPTLIARKLESTVDSGGWESL